MNYARSQGSDNVSHKQTNFFAMIMSLTSMVRAITTMIRVFTSSDQGLDRYCFCCHRMLRGDSSCDILKNPYRKI